MAAGARNLNQDLNRNIHRPDNVNGVLGLMSVTDPIPEQELTGSSYTISSTQSQFSYAVDNWIRGSNATSPNNPNPVVAGIPTRPVQSPQPPQLPPGPSHEASGIWYTLAMLLPLLTVNSGRTWGCSASTLFHAAHFFATQITHLCRGIHNNLRTLANDQIARDIFGMAMDIILIIYAIGFLVLSMYQASIFN